MCLCVKCYDDDVILHLCPFTNNLLLSMYRDILSRKQLYRCIQRRKISFQVYRTVIFSNSGLKDIFLKAPTKLKKNEFSLTEF